MKQIVIVLLTLSVLVMTGCTEDAEPVNPPNEAAPISTLELSQGRRIEVYRLDDGSECAVLKGVRQGGLDCNWAD